MLKKFNYDTDAADAAAAKLAQETSEWGKDPKVLGVGANREWQLTAYDKLLPTRQNEMIAPCGSGKSILQSALAIGDYIESKKTRKQLISVPQVHIAAGFFPSDGAIAGISIHGVVHKVQVPVEFNFAQDPSVKRLKKWLLAHTTWCEDGKVISGPIAMTSHAALVAAWKSLSIEEKKLVVKTTHFRDDESHHTARGSELVVADKGGNQNLLGAIMRFVHEHDGFCTSSTATGFRGDKKTLRPKSYKVNRYSRSFIEHFNGLGIDTFLLEMVVSDNPVQQAAALIASEPHEKHFVVVPPRNAGWRAALNPDGKPVYADNPDTDEYPSIDALTEAIKKDWPLVRIHNVVPQDESRQDKKNTLLGEPKFLGQKESEFDVLITCRLGREGSDWVPCSRLHVTSNDYSIVMAVQTLGRLFRYYKGKDKIVARYYRKPILIPKKGMTAHEILDDSKNAILLALQFDEMFFPIRFPMYKEGTAGTGTESDSCTEPTIAELIGDEENSKLLAKLIGINKLAPGLLSAEEIHSTVKAMLMTYPELASLGDENVERFTRTLLLRYMRYVSGQFPKVDIAFVRNGNYPQFEQMYTALPEGGMLYSHEYSKPNRDLLNKIFQIAWQEYAKAYKLQLQGIADAPKKPSQNPPDSAGTAGVAVHLSPKKPPSSQGAKAKAVKATA